MLPLCIYHEFDVSKQDEVLTGWKLERAVIGDNAKYRDAEQTGSIATNEEVLDGLVLKKFQLVLCEILYGSGINRWLISCAER